MSRYLQVDFTWQSHLEPEIVCAFLADLPFETFENEPQHLRAYVQSALLVEDELIEALKQFSEADQVAYAIQEVPDENWNETWETNFPVVEIGTKLLIRAPFHLPDPSFEDEIIVEPQMSFGTGHHPTTYLIAEAMLEEGWVDKSVLDMGCGTGILAILAKKKGAKTVVAVDIEQICLDSTLHNAKLNGVEFGAVCGDIDLIIGTEPFDVIIANINKNVLKRHMPEYVNLLCSGGTIFFSGFFVSDLEEMIEVAEKHGFNYFAANEKDSWCMLTCTKK